MFLNLIIKSITQTVAGVINSSESDKRIRSLNRKDSIQRGISNSDTKMKRFFLTKEGAGTIKQLDQAIAKAECCNE